MKGKIIFNKSYMSSAWEMIKKMKQSMENLIELSCLSGIVFEK